MSRQLLHFIIAIVFIAHGIGHSMGIGAAIGLVNTETWNSRSWLLTDTLGATPARVIGFVIWVVVFLGFLGAALGSYGWLVPQEWWRTMAVVSAVISLVGLLLFWNSLASMSSKIGAIGVDIAVLVAILWANWPSEADFGF